MTKLRKLCLDRRAITPVLSSLLLTVVAVAAMAIATSATYLVTTNLGETMGERVVIEDLWFNNPTGYSARYIGVYLRNVGKVAIHVSSVYINRSSQLFTKPFSLETGQHGWINISENWVPDSLYYVDVVTTRGTHVGGYYVAPST
jgi:hypothetical protein